KRVVITEVGVIAPNGADFNEFSMALQQGRSGLGEISYFNAEKFLCRIVGQAKGLNKETILNRFPEFKNIDDNKVILGMQAFCEAFNGKYDLIHDCAINLGTSLESFYIQKLFEYSPDKFNIDTYIRNVIDKRKQKPYLQNPLDFFGNFLLNKFKILGPNFLNCSACTASTQAIGHSFNMISDGRYKRIITGGLDSMLNPLGLGGFSVLGALNTENDLGTESIRPFDIRRKGTILGEGAAIFLLEELDSAIERNAHIYAEIIGYSSSFDAYKLSKPDVDALGVIAAMNGALKDARVSSQEIDYVNAHGTGTPLNDSTETLAIKKVFGEQAYKIPVSSLKSMIGHLIGASGAVEIAGILAMFRDNFIAPTINLKKPDPDCDLDYVPNSARHEKINIAMKNSMGFGGQNACLILKRFNPIL
ncbi:beta-ketoacyl-[acyl-carrier-protein] synthase family protein, partial [bacterium]|nr:beta-ketoacyl-[acyl-carrier-protein] synthase family protein [bacterium]